MGTKKRRNVPQYKLEKNRRASSNMDSRNEYYYNYKGPQLLSFWDNYVHTRTSTRNSVIVARLLLAVIAIVTCLSFIASYLS